MVLCAEFHVAHSLGTRRSSYLLDGRLRKGQHPHLSTRTVNTDLGARPFCFSLSHFRHTVEGQKGGPPVPESEILSESRRNQTTTSVVLDLLSSIAAQRST
jgi:hypothetical protein